MSTTHRVIVLRCELFYFQSWILYIDLIEYKNITTDSVTISLTISNGFDNS